MSKLWAIAVHGGAGPMRRAEYNDAEAHMAETLRAGIAHIEAGMPALDIAQFLITELEACGHHIAGKGAAPNAEGRWELDAAIMDGQSRNAGAVAALEGFKSPIAAARAVLDKSPHVLLVGEGAIKFAGDNRLERVEDPKAYYTPAVTRPVKPGELAHGTVGATVLDIEGRLAAATSTGGLLGTAPGRVGDSPLFGAGTWADERAAISCTGQGEYFIRTNAAADVSARLRYGGGDLEDAAEGVIEDVKNLGGDGGLIAVGSKGHVAAPFLSEGMKRGIATSAGRFEVAVKR